MLKKVSVRHLVSIQQLCLQISCRDVCKVMMSELHSHDHSGKNTGRAIVETRKAVLAQACES